MNSHLQDLFISSLVEGGSAGPKCDPPCGSILVIEDEKGIRETLQYALELENYHVYSASNGREGLELLRQIPRPCLILLDLMMPVMDGWGFIEAVAKDPSLTNIPIVVVTAFSEKAREIKAQQVLRKPVDLDEICEIARQWCPSAA